jgi:hypothetical protein
MITLLKPWWAKSRMFCSVQSPMNQWLASHEEQVTDLVFSGDIDDVSCFLQRHTPPLLRIEPVNREPAEIAFRVANVRDGELQISWTAIRQHFPHQLPRPLPWLD